MAPSKKASPSKHSMERKASAPKLSPLPSVTSHPQPPRSAIRRSSRMQKKLVEKELPDPETQLLGAAKLLHDNIQDAMEQSTKKRVAFDNKGEKTERSKSPTRVSSAPQTRPVSNIQPVIHEQVIFPASRIRIPPTEHTIPPPQPSALPPSRAASIRKLQAADILTGTRAAKTSSQANRDGTTDVPVATKLVKTPKRNQNDTLQDEDVQIQRSTKRQRANDANHSSAEQPSNPTEHSLSQLHNHPRILSLTEISSMLLLIQTRIFGSFDGKHQGFSARYFSFILTPAQCAAWPLHELKTKYMPLYMNARYLADGSQYGWRSFFTQSTTRQHIVSAILGEWFVQRIFKHTAFGFPQHLVDILEDKDREFLHYDAVVRSKERAKLLRTWYADWKVWPRILDTTTAAASALADELLTVLHPLLPPILFDPFESSPGQLVNGRKPIAVNASVSQRHRVRSEIKRDLVNLIMDCIALHKGIRLTGEDGTIVRMCPVQEKGSQFHPTASVHCVNQVHCNQTCPSDPNEKSELCIKMTCFPRVEAVVPNGPDMQELGQKEAELRQALIDEEDNEPQTSPSKGLTSRPRSDEDDFSFSSSSSNCDSDSDAASEPSFTWDDHDSIWPIVPDTLQDIEGRNPGVLDPETKEINTVKRSAWVKLYQVITPAFVYCEWTPQPYHVPATSTLDAAIIYARATHSTATRLKLEDLTITAWNTWAIYGGIAQWGVLTTAAVFTVCRALSIPSHIQHALIQITTALGSVVRRAAPLTRIPVEQLLAQMSDQFTDILRAGYNFTGPFGPAMTRPFETLVIAPLHAVFKLLADSADGVRRAVGLSTGTMTGTSTICPAPELSEDKMSLVVDVVSKIGENLSQASLGNSNEVSASVESLSKSVSSEAVESLLGVAATVSAAVAVAGGASASIKSIVDTGNANTDVDEIPFTGLPELSTPIGVSTPDTSGVDNSGTNCDVSEATQTADVKGTDVEIDENTAATKHDAQRPRMSRPLGWLHRAMGVWG